jgi:hypothetical protein
MDRIQRARDPILLAIWAIVLNIVANLLTDGVKALDLGPDWLLSRIENVLFGALLVILIAAYWWTRPKTAKTVLSDQSGRSLPATVTTFYDGRAALAGTEHTIERELEDNSVFDATSGYRPRKEIWAAWYAGTHVGAGKLLRRGGPTTRLILANPDDTRFVAIMGETFGREPAHLVQDIRELTRQALDAGVDVRWHSGIYVGSVVEHPAPLANTKVRLDIPVGGSGRRPIVVVTRDEFPDLVKEYVSAYEAMWSSPMSIDPSDATAVAKFRAAQADDGEVHDLRRALASVQDDHLKYLTLSLAQQSEIEAMKPRAAWADALVERERGAPQMLYFRPLRAEVWNQDHLEDPSDPYFEIGIFYDYVGVLHMTIGDGCTGHLSWDGREFPIAPRFTAFSSTPLPIETDGPASGHIRIRQYLSVERAAELRAYLGKRAEMEFQTKDLAIPLVITTFEGVTLYAGRLIGEHLSARTNR